MYGGVPEWLISAFRKRIDEWDQRIQTNPRCRERRELVSMSFDRLEESLSKEQLRLFMEWEERMSFQVSEEKEELYIRGFLDGFQLNACLDEISVGFMPANGMEKKALMNNRKDPSVNPVHVTGNFMPVFGRGKGFENVKNTECNRCPSYANFLD